MFKISLCKANKVEEDPYCRINLEFCDNKKGEIN